MLDILYFGTQESHILQHLYSLFPSLSSKQWEWDEEVIQQRSVSYDVAELLTRRMLRLPTSSMKSLQIISIFGSEVTLQVLDIIRDVCGITDITTELDHPASEGLIKIDEEACRFVHDLIEHSVRVGIKPDDKQSMLKEVSEKLLLKTSDDRHDDILFIIVGLVNSMDVGGASVVDRLNYANLNLRAGEKVSHLGYMLPSYINNVVYSLT